MQLPAAINSTLHAWQVGYGHNLVIQTQQWQAITDKSRHAQLIKQALEIAVSASR